MRRELCLAVAAAASLAVASPAAANVVYIPLGPAGTILIVDANRDAAIGRIEGVPAVHGLAATPDGRFLIAGSYEERATGEASPPRPQAVGEEEHAAHHAKPPADAKRAAAVVSTVSIISTHDNAVVRRIDVPGAVHHVAASPDGRMAVVTHPNEGTVTAIDLRNYSIATIATGSLPNYAVFSPDGRRLFVSNAGNGTVSDINIDRWIVLRNMIVGKGPEHVVLSKDGSRLYVNNVDGGTVSVVATDQGEVVRTFPVGTTLHGIDLSDDGKTLFVAALGDNKLAAIDLASGNSREARLAPAPYHVAVVRGRGRIYVSSANEPIVWVVDPMALTVSGEIKIGGKGHQMVLGPGS